MAVLAAVARSEEVREEIYGGGGRDMGNGGAECSLPLNSLCDVGHL
jgi:hypothetical protein